jgi:hypothetical protein
MLGANWGCTWMDPSSTPQYRSLIPPASASEDHRRAPHDIQWGDMSNQPPRSSGMPPSPGEWCSSSSCWDLGEITRRMETVDMQTGKIQYNLEEHIAQTQEWQQIADAQFTNINNLMQQQHDDLQAYFRLRGLILIMDPE